MTYPNFFSISQLMADDFSSIVDFATEEDLWKI